MIEFSVLGTGIKISPLFFAVLTAFLIADKNGMACYAVLFSLLHETGHILVLLCMKEKPKLIETSAFGIHISLKENMSTAEKIAVLISGFAVNFILAAVFFITGNPFFGYINLAIGIFTAIPLSSTDGGAVLRTIIDEKAFDKGEKFFRIISFSFLVIICSVFVIAAFRTENYFLFIAIFYMVVCALK